MKLTQRQDTGSLYRRQMVEFSGLDLTDGAAEGTLRDCGGLSSKRWPVLSQRGGRGAYEEVALSEPTAIFAFDKLCVLDDGTFYYDGAEVGYVETGEKQFAVVGKKLCIWPDGRYLDISDPEALTWGSLSATVKALEGSAVFTESALTISTNPGLGEKLEKLRQSFSDNKKWYLMVYEEVSFDADSKQWTATGGKKVQLAQNDSLDLVGKYIILTADGDYQEVCASGANPLLTEAWNTTGAYAVITSYSWVEKESYVTYYVYAQTYDGSKRNTDLTEVFAVGDGVSISGATEEDNNKDAVIRAVTEDTLTFDSNLFVAGADTAAVTVERTVPEMDFICEWNNRLWGVKDKTVYASALGQPQNFNVFDGLSTDSYAVEVGTDGAFTAVCRYSDSVLFWKENVLHKMLGSVPADFYLYTYDVAGVQAGSEKSLQIINEVLYYMGRAGVYAYTGGRPQRISSVFGTRQYYGGVAGADSWRYYLSVLDTAGESHLLVYDTRQGIWLREDDTRARQFATLDATVHLLSEGGEIFLLDQQSEESVAWYAELNPFRETVHNRKMYSKLFLRMTLEAGANMTVEVKSDDGLWQTIWTGHRAGTEVIPVIPNRCDQFSVRLSGEGTCAVESLMRQVKVGGYV